MLRALDIQRIAIGAGLLVVGIGAFALGRSVSDTLAPTPVVVEQPEPAVDAPRKRKKKSTEQDGQAAQAAASAGEGAASGARTPPSTERTTSSARSTQSETSPIEQTGGEAPRPDNVEPAGVSASADPEPKPRRAQHDTRPEAH